ncbi:MAG: S41 family peptidase [Caldilineaceae bacterium]
MNESLSESGQTYGESIGPEDAISTATGEAQPRNEKLGGHNLPLMAGILFMLLTFAAGLGLGFNIGLWRAQTESANLAVTSTDPDVGHAAEPSSSARTVEALNQQFDVFWEAMDLLYHDFYGEIPSSEQMTFGAIQGAIDLLDDPNTSFLTPEEAEFFRSNIEGSFEGIGARVEWDVQADAVRITEPFENQPAWNAGLRRGDLLVAIDGESLSGSNLTEAIKKIRGKKGSTVVLSVLHSGANVPVDVPVVRDRIEIPTVTAQMVGDGQDIAYVRLSSFNENASRQVRQGLEDLLSQNPQGLIFDLRGNSGGLLREAVAVTSLFQEEGNVLIERFADGSEKIYPAEGQAVAPTIPMLVLVNGGSASASEIVAGALQDAKRAQLLGEITYGKGSVQLPHRLSNNGILRVTIARWFTPNDRTIDGAGLEPDIPVELTDEQRIAGDDPQLTRAIEYFNAQ